VIDTPGYSDFIGEVISSLSVVDMAMVVIHATQGLEVGTELTWQQATKYNLPKMVVINALNKEHTKFDEVVESARELLSKRIFPVQLPVNAGPGFNQIADVVRCKLMTYKTDGSGKFEESELPADLKEKVESLHQELIEYVAESDDALLEKFFDQGGLSEEEMQEGLQAAVQSLIPLFCASGLTNVGVTRIMDFIARYGCAPSHRPTKSVLGGDGTEVIEINVTDSEPAVFVFKTVSEAHVGELSFFRVYSGSISTGMDLQNSARSDPARY